MIIFDLDGTLADCEHRRHFVDPLVSRPNGEDYALSFYSPYLNIDYFYKYADGKPGFFYHDTHQRWHPDWKAFYEACEQDKPIIPVINILKSFIYTNEVEGCKSDIFDIQIWTGRCESARYKTGQWILSNILNNEAFPDLPFILKMRPIGDNTPECELKERWLDELIIKDKENIYTTGSQQGCVYIGPKPIDFVFDSDPKSIAMWQRRGVFVFNCAQHDGEF